MIQNDRELEVTRQRIEQFQNWLGQMRQNAEPRDFVTNGAASCKAI